MTMSKTIVINELHYCPCWCVNVTVSMLISRNRNIKTYAKWPIISYKSMELSHHGIQQRLWFKTPISSEAMESNPTKHFVFEGKDNNQLLGTKGLQSGGNMSPYLTTNWQRRQTNETNKLGNPNHILYTHSFQEK